MKTTHSGEVQFVRWTDSSKSGPCVTFRLHDREELEAFIGMEGKRFMGAFVGIADDETPIEPAKSNSGEFDGIKPEEKPKGGALAKLAGQWCADPVFRAWLVLTDRVITDDIDLADAEVAAIWLRHACEVNSRAELDHNPEAADKFHRLIREPYMQYLKGVAK